jgi:hypothetical protein
MQGMRASFVLLKYRATGRKRTRPMHARRSSCGRRTARGATESPPQECCAHAGRRAPSPVRFGTTLHRRNRIGYNWFIRVFGYAMKRTVTAALQQNIRRPYPRTALRGSTFPLVFLLAASAQAAPEGSFQTANLAPGALRPLLQNSPLDPQGSVDPTKPQGQAVVDPATRTVQWFNWPNWFNCFSGAWRRC